MNESDIAKLLSSVPLFTQIEHHDLELVAARMKEVHFEPGRVIAKQGDSGVGFHLIVEGDAEVSGDGVPKHTIGAGGYFGEIGLIDGGVRSATVTAATELTTLALVGLPADVGQPRVRQGTVARVVPARARLPGVRRGQLATRVRLPRAAR